MSGQLEEYSVLDFTCYKLSRAVRKVQRYYELHLAEFGITTAQFFVLCSLREHDGVKFKELAKRISMDGATLTGILDRLEKFDLAQRRADPEDRRSLLVFLSPKAHELFPKFEGLAATLETNLRTQFELEDFTVFTKVLEKLAQESE
jgi:DNA-binding MarR family transcriptional regulator